MYYVWCALSHTTCGLVQHYICMCVVCVFPVIVRGHFRFRGMHCWSRVPGELDVAHKYKSIMTIHHSWHYPCAPYVLHTQCIVCLIYHGFTCEENRQGYTYHQIAFRNAVRLGSHRSVPYDYTYFNHWNHCNGHKMTLTVLWTHEIL